MKTKEGKSPKKKIDMIKTIIHMTMKEKEKEKEEIIINQENMKKEGGKMNIEKEEASKGKEKKRRIIVIKK